MHHVVQAQHFVPRIHAEPRTDRAEVATATEGHAQQVEKRQHGDLNLEWNRTMRNQPRIPSLSFFMKHPQIMGFSQGTVTW